MARYIVKRLLIALVVLFGITIIDFAIMTMAGNPIQIISGGPKVQKEVLAQKLYSMSAGSFRFSRAISATPIKLMNRYLR